MSRSVGMLAVLFLLIATSAVASQPRGASIESVWPPVGDPSGGQMIRINGYGFDSPVRVFFASDTGVTIESFVVSATPTQIDAITPAFELPAGVQRSIATITVAVRAGTAFEVRTSKQNAFEFRNEILAPSIRVAVPNRHATPGGGHLTIFGDGFQVPVQVFAFTDALPPVEMRVIAADFGEIAVLVPAADEIPIGEPVHLRVQNIASQTSTEYRDAFRYTTGPIITSVSPNAGPSWGGTRVTIDGTGFEAPVYVLVAGIEATPIFVTPARIVALTSPIPSPCADQTAPVVVTNLVTGALAEGPDFTVLADANCPRQAILILPNQGNCRLIRASQQRTTIEIANHEQAGQDLYITSTDLRGRDAADFSLEPRSAIIPPGTSARFIVSVKPDAAAPREATIVFTTSDSMQPTVSVCVRTLDRDSRWSAVGGRRWSSAQASADLRQ